MGGLLEKATTTKTEQSEGQTFEPAAVTVATSTPNPTPTASGPAGGSSPSGSPDTAQKIGLAGWVVIIIGAILSLQGGAFGLLIVGGVLVIGIGCIVAAERMKGGVNNVKMIGSIVIAILIAAGPYAVLMIVPTNASMAITEISVDETNNELDFRVRGSFDSVDVSITADGTEMWTASKEKSNEFVSFSVGLSEIFAGNSENYAGSSQVNYVIKAETSNGQSQEIDIPSQFLTREAQNAGMKITALRDSNDVNEYLGIEMQLLVGLINPSETAQDGGGFTAVGLRPMNADYTVDVTVTGGTTWSESTISVDGDLATWTSQTSATGTGSTDGWFALTGSKIDTNGVYYLDKEEFYNGDKCYTFSISIVNEVSNTQVFETEFGWNIDLSSADSAGENMGDGVTTTC
ncbi:MAG: hypothetical protein VW230_03860 [Candidatus Poseidoniales archaeon]